MRCIPGNDLILEGLVGGLFAFELDNFDNLPFGNIGTTLNAKLTIDDSKERQKKKKMEYVDIDRDTDDEDIE